MELIRSLGSLVKMAIRPTDWMFSGSIPGMGKKFFFSLKRPDRLWGPRSFLVIGFRSSFRGVIRTVLLLVSKLGVSGDTQLLPLHAVMACTG
jgi:hypothetical protein